MLRVTCNHQGLRLVEMRQELWDKKRVAVASGVSKVKPNVPFLVQIANFSNKAVRLFANERVGISHPVPIPASEKEIAAAVDEESESDGRFDIKRLARPFREIWNQVSTITFEGEDEPVPDSIEIDPELERQAHVEEPPGFKEISLSHLTEEQKARVEEMAAPFKDLWGPGLGKVNITSHRLHLEEGARPSYAQPYRAAGFKRQVIEKEIEKMLDLSVIEPAVSEWAAPVVLAPKPGGKWRFCVDYRKLNAMTKREVYPLPRLEDCIDSLGDAKWFSTLDANSGYWQIAMDPRDKAKTAFTTHCGTYQYTRMPFGLKNAPATFQRALDMVLAGYRWKSCLVYIDDVIVFSKSFDEHLVHVKEVFRCPIKIRNNT